MIKFVLQTIPAYIMSIFLLPNSLIDVIIEKMMNELWWGIVGCTGCWGIINLSVNKNNGGMSFKDLTRFNVAMLGKHGWKF